MPEVWFPHLNIQIYRLNNVAISIFGFEIYWYAIFILTGILLGLMYALREVKRTGQDPDLYINYLLFAFLFCIMGARLYYVIFSWNDYKNNFIKIINIREGGLAIYGGVIAAVLTAIIYAKRYKINFWLFADTAAPSLLVGQAVGRIGNFFNREAFGGYTDTLFAMRYVRSQVGYVSEEVLEKVIQINGIEYIQVHPTFLYESLWNIGALIFISRYRKRQKFAGEIFFMYILLYSAGRFWIEGLRTDQLLIPHTSLAVSQILSLVLFIFSFTVILWKGKKVIL